MSYMDGFLSFTFLSIINIYISCSVLENIID